MATLTPTGIGMKAAQNVARGVAAHENVAGHSISDAEFLRSVGISAEHIPVLKQEKETTFEKIEAAPIMMVAWQLPMLGQAADFLKGIGARTWFGKYAGAPLRALGRGIAVPADYLNKQTMGDVAEGVSHIGGRIKNTVSRAMGGADTYTSSVVVGEPTLASRFEAIGGHIDEALKEPAFKPLNYVRNKLVTFFEWRADRASTNAVELHTKAHRHLDLATQALSGRPDEDASTALHYAKKKFEPAKLEAIQEVETARHAAKARPLSKVLEADSKILESGQKSFARRVTGIQETLKAQKEVAPRAAREAIKEELNAIAGARKNVSKFAKNMLKSHGHIAAQAEHLESAAFLKNFQTSLGKIPETLSKMPVNEALNHGLYAAAQTATTIRTGRLFTSGLHTMKHMYASLTGTPLNKVSSLQVMFGKVPAPMVEARHQFVKSVIPQVLANGVGMVAFSKMMKGGSFMVGFGAQMGSGMIGGAIASHYSFLETYNTFTQAKQAGQKLPAGAYLGLMVKASPKKIGKMEETDAKLYAVAQEYAKEGATAAMVMNEIYNGMFDKRYAAVPESQAIKSQQPVPVVGKHTGKENLRRIGNAAELAADIAMVSSLG